MVYGKQKCGFYMSEPKGNKNLVWINTPFSLTKLDKQYTLLQQNILMVASTHLQKYVEEYFTEKRAVSYTHLTLEMHAPTIFSRKE